MATVEQSRRSGRTVKRPRYDDEPISSSLNIYQTPTTPDPIGLTSESLPSSLLQQQQQQQLPAGTTKKQRNRKTTTTTKTKTSTTTNTKANMKDEQIQKNMSRCRPLGSANSQIGRWKPQDDLALISNVQQTCDLVAVFHGVQFSCRFSLQEIEQRWHSLLYDPVISKLAITAMQQLHPSLIVDIRSKTIFSRMEENLLAEIPSTTVPDEEFKVFQELLSCHRTEFNIYRTAKSLAKHWTEMCRYQLVCDQKNSLLGRPVHFVGGGGGGGQPSSQAESEIVKKECRSAVDPILQQELDLADGKVHDLVSKSNDEASRWRCIVEKVTGTNLNGQVFDDETYALLKGRVMRFLIRAKEIRIGRSTAARPMDVNLNLEGPAWRASRLQAIIRLDERNQFSIRNCGKRSIFIDGIELASPNSSSSSSSSSKLSAGQTSSSSSSSSSSAAMTAMTTTTTTVATAGSSVGSNQTTPIRQSKPYRLTHNSVIEIAGNLRLIFIINEKLLGFSSPV